MPLYSTVFFFNGNPVGYNVFESKPGELVLRPAESKYRAEQPSVLSARLINGNWIIKGTNNQSLIDQVKKELSLNNLLLHKTIMAAP